MAHSDEREAALRDAPLGPEAADLGRRRFLIGGVAAAAGAAAALGDSADVDAPESLLLESLLPESLLDSLAAASTLGTSLLPVAGLALP